MEAVKKVLQSGLQTAESAVSNLTADAKTKDLAKETVADATPGNRITTNFGCPIADTDNSLKAGERGPTLLQDFIYREKMTHFDHERIPERVVHARGAAAHGYFQVYESLEDITKADFLCNPNKKTPVFLRFSTVMGSKGSADTVRDVRGFAVKFYTEEGNFDMVGNNIPVFFIQDAIKFPDIIHAGKPEPNNEIPQAQTAHDNFWDFISLNEESAHMVMWILSDRAIPKSFRTMQGFGVHSFVLVNKEGKRRFVKFHWQPTLGVHSLVWDEAQKLGGIDPDFHRRDLQDAIDAGAFPEWELGLQIVEEADAEKFDFDLLDATKLIPEELVPIRKVGKMVLNRNVDNYFAETEQVAYHTAHLVPGIETSDDPLLQGRHHSYVDTQLIRLGGPNYQEIPINRPVCPVTNNQRDGFSRQTINSGKVNYWPNRFGCPALDKIRGYNETPAPIGGVKIRTRGPKFFERHNQARLFLHSLAPWERQHLTDAATFELGHCDDLGVREKMIEFLAKIDLELAVTVANGIGVKPPTSGWTKNDSQSPAVSQQVINDRTPKSIKTRKIAFILGPGYNGAQLLAARAALEAQGAVTQLVGPHKGEIPSDTEAVKATAQWSFLTAKSLIFDGVFIVGGQQSINFLKSNGNAMAFVTEAYKHCKPIIAINEGVDFVASLEIPKVQLATSAAVAAFQGVVSTKEATKSFEFSQKEGDDLFGRAVFNAIAAHRHYERDISRVAA